MAAANLFKQAKSIETQKVASAKKQKAEFQLPGIKTVAELDSLVKSASAILKTISKQVKDAAMDIFVENANGKMPESFRGVEGIASASVECRKRGTNSPLSDAEVEVLQKAGIEVHKQVVVQQLYGINPKYSQDEKMLEKISKALSKAGVPDDLIVVQEEVSKFVVDEKAANKAYELNNREAIEIVSCLALKPKLETTNIGEVMDDLKAIVVAYAESAKDEEKAA